MIEVGDRFIYHSPEFDVEMKDALILFFTFRKINNFEYKVIWHLEDSGRLNYWYYSKEMKFFK